MLEFVRQLLSVGQVILNTADVPSDEEIESAVELCLKIEEQQRSELPLVPPVVDEAWLQWALVMMYSACQLQVFRNLDETEISLRLSSNWPKPPDSSSASHHYSVDIAMRFLPDLYLLVNNSMSNDPLAIKLREWSECWPLSSVGMADVNSDSSVVLSHACLRSMYVDRIIERQDKSRLQDEAVRKAVDAALGAYADSKPSKTNNL
jgi:hypothetical protein